MLGALEEEELVALNVQQLEYRSACLDPPSLVLSTCYNLTCGGTCLCTGLIRQIIYVSVLLSNIQTSSGCHRYEAGTASRPPQGRQVGTICCPLF